MCIRDRVYDASANGLCCANGEGGYELFVDDALVRAGGSFGGLVESTPFSVAERAEPECYSMGDASDYRGSARTTVDGARCQRWTEHVPHAHNFSSEAQPHAGLGAHNFCRNPDGSDGAWCFTLDEDIVRAPCALPKPKEKCAEDAAAIALAELLETSAPSTAATSARADAARPALGLAAIALALATVARGRPAARAEPRAAAGELL